MIGNVQIVEKRQSDIIALRELFLNVRRNTFTWLDPLIFEPLDFDSFTEGEYVLVAICENKVAGFVSIWLEDNFVHHLYIDEKYQRKGIGTQLLKALTEKINSPIKLKCLERNTKAAGFYKKNGFVVKEKGVSDEGDYILFELAKK